MVQFNNPLALNGCDNDACELDSYKHLSHDAAVVSGTVVVTYYNVDNEISVRETIYAETTVVEGSDTYYRTDVTIDYYNYDGNIEYTITKPIYRI